MKVLNLIGLLLVAAGSVQAQGVVFSVDKPEAGEKIQFSYNPKGTTLDKLIDIKCSLITFNSTYATNKAKVDLVMVNGVYKGEFLTSDSVSLIGLDFSAGSQRDEAPNGYLLEFTKKGKVQAETFLNEGLLYGLAGNFYFGLKLDAAKGAKFYKQAFEMKPALEEKYSRDYLSLSLKADKENGTKLINEKIAQLSKIGDKSKEADFLLQMNLYGLLRKQPQVDSVKSILLQRYPTGNYAYSMDINALRMERNPLMAEHKSKSIIATYKIDSKNKADVVKLANIDYTLARVFATSDDNEKFEFYANKIENKIIRAAMYNSAAWALAEKNKNSAFAAKISKRSLDLLNEAKKEPVPKIITSNEAYFKEIDRQYAMYADTYALLLHNLGNDKEAVTYQEMADQFSDAKGNERYVMYLDLAGEKEKAFTKAESSINEGKSTDAMKARLKDLYVSLKKGNDVNAYMAGIDKKIANQEREIWTKKMINIPSPDFALKNLKGETVTLASLKGKVVILDYWATWCGPCVASFPGMKKAIAKYANNPNVVFLFINTFQREENREKVVTDFVAAKKLDFNILYDTRNAKDPEKFDLANANKITAIPTKFILDQKGNIRFKATGFSGSDEGVVKEIDAMLGFLLDKKTSK